MAGQLRTDITAVAAAVISGDRSAMPAGFNLDEALETLQKKRDDVARLAGTINGYLPSGSAKTAMGTVISDLA
jgi:hypothetical protein